MNTIDFQTLFPEISDSSKILSDLKALQRFRKQTDEDFETTLNDFSIVRLKYKWYIEKPAAYLWKVISNSTKRNVSRTVFKSIDEKIDFVEEKINDEPSFDFKSTQQILSDFLKSVRNIGLPPKQIRLIEIMVLLCEEKHETYFDFMQEVNKAAISSGMSYDDVRQTLSRLRKNMRGKDEIKGLLSFTPVVHSIDDDVIDIMISFIPPTSPLLSAYRFSEEELDKMKWLKELFENNGYSFDPNRYPEVYYDEFEKVKEVFPWINNGQEGTPDALGVYIYNFENGFGVKPCDKTKEGIIVLFKDKIEQSFSDAEVSSVRFVVLMHELGHWLTHWSKRDNYNWTIGFHLPNKFTKEAFAQLVAYWACCDKAIHYQTLINLTPKVASLPENLELIILKDDLLYDGTSINTDDPYGKYWLLKEKPIELILDKLHHLREGWILNDQKMIEYLISAIENFEEWIEPQVELFDSYLLNKLYESGCMLNISKRIMELKGFGEGFRVDYGLLLRFGVVGQWHENEG
jgi:hypothetical protein